MRSIAAVLLMTVLSVSAPLPQALAAQGTTGTAAQAEASSSVSQTTQDASDTLLDVTSISTEDPQSAQVSASGASSVSSVSGGQTAVVDAAASGTTSTTAVTGSGTTSTASKDRYTSTSKSFFELMQESFPLLLSGLGLTVELAIVSLLLAMVMGMITCLMNISRFRVLKWIAQIYINIIRGTPLLVQAFFIYFGVTQAFGFRMTAFEAGVISLCLNAGGYLAEIFRGGVQAVDPGQMEAARSLGLSWWQSMRKVILPQAIRICIPSVVNQWIITLKDTSIISVIGLAELTYAGSQIIARTFRSFDIWLMVGILYFIVIYALTKLSKLIERRVSLAKHEG